MNVKLIKLKGTRTSKYRAGYWVQGWLNNKPKVGQRVSLSSPITSSLKEIGFDWWQTTEVKSVKDYSAMAKGGLLITTQNSEWLLKEI